MIRILGFLLRIWLQITSLFRIARIFPFVLRKAQDERKKPFWAVIFGGILSLLPIFGHANDTALTEILARIHQDGAAEFRYQETRTLELATAPWQGQGLMLSSADGSLVKLQQQPNRVIMAIAADKMYYWDAAQNQRHVAPLEQTGPAAQILVFRNLLQGHADELRTSYDLNAEQHAQHWTLRMTPKADQADNNATTIEISGDQDPNQRQLLIRQPDGETTEYRLTKTSEGQESAASIQRLLLEAAGE